MRFLFFIFLLQVGLIQNSLAQNQCHSLFQEADLNSQYHERKSHLDENIWLTYYQEVQHLEIAELKQKNKELLKSIEAEIPTYSTTRAHAVTKADLQKMIYVTSTHDVVSPLLSKYQQEDVSIGYCFGRATYIHLTLLKMGLQKESIQKIWVLGEINNPLGATWGFHVATMAYTSDYGWMVIDTSLLRPVTVREWIETYTKRSLNNEERFYTTDASKFALDQGYYNSIQLGLKLTPEQDWYKNYFKDMLQSVRYETLDDLGLRDLKERPSEMKFSFIERMTSKASLEYARVSHFIDVLMKDHTSDHNQKHNQEE